jgi:Abortive infection alpha
VTGGEIVAAGKATKAAGKKLFAEDEKTKDVLLRLGETTPPMKAAAYTRAVRIAAVERAKLQIRKPFLLMFGVPHEWLKNEFWQEFADKTADIPDEHFITPAPGVAVPALQGLSYTFEEPNLKDMFLSLLATASDDRRAGQAHPAFAEIIKQLSPDEAQVLNAVLGSGRQHPIARLVDKPVDLIGSPAENFTVLVPHLLNLARRSGELVEEPRMSMWVDNWIRLGLVEIAYDEYVSGENRYDWVKSRPEYVSLSTSGKFDMVDFIKGVLRPNSLGKQFFSAVR